MDSCGARRKKESRLLFLGERPGRGSDGTLLGSAGRRLAGLAGISMDRLAAIDRENAWGRDDPRRVVAARERLLDLQEKLDGRIVVALGRKVAAVLGLGACPWLRLRPVRVGEVRFLVALIPHPSGRCRWYNSPENVERTKEFLLGVIEMAGEKESTEARN